MDQLKALQKRADSEVNARAAKVSERIVGFRYCCTGTILILYCLALDFFDVAVEVRLKVGVVDVDSCDCMFFQFAVVFVVIEYL